MQLLEPKRTVEFFTEIFLPDHENIEQSLALLTIEKEKKRERERVISLSPGTNNLTGTILLSQLASCGFHQSRTL